MGLAMHSHGRMGLLAVLWLSCGLGPNDHFTGARQSSGVAPWVDLGGANLCEAPALLGPADSTPVGFCVPDSAQALRACTFDTECGARERCVCGRCSVQYCDSAAGCGKALSCDFKNKRCARKCSKTARCAFGQTCRGGFCTAKCMTDSECAAGELCNQVIQRCVVAACGDNANCLVGKEHCAIQRVPAEVREPALVPDVDPRKQPVLYVEIRRMGRGAIYRALSPDGVGWTLDPAEPILEPAADETRIGAPAAVRTDAGWLLFFDAGPMGTRIDRATSSDGVHFTRDVAPALEPASPWEGGKVHAPGVTRTARGVYLAYEGGDGAGLGLAFAADGRSFTRVGDGLQLSRDDVGDPLLWRNVNAVGSPSLAAHVDDAGDELLDLWFSAHGLESSSVEELGTPRAAVPNWSIGYAATRVPKTGDPRFEVFPWNPVFDRVLSFLQHEDELSPTVARLPGGNFAMLYGAIGSKGSYDNLGLALHPPEAAPR